MLKNSPKQDAMTLLLPVFVQKGWVRETSKFMRPWNTGTPLQQMQHIQ